jgi:hypothetical protein
MVLGLLGCLLAVGLARELLAARPLPASPVPRTPPPAAPTATAAPPAPSAAGYGAVAAKNLFSPTRSEAAAGPAVAAGPRPVLHGVVMDGPKSRAFLEDPLLKRTFGYSVGDTVGGGRVESIAADRVVITRGDGLLEVLLHDPSKPKPAPAVAAQAPAVASPVTAAQPGAGSAPAPGAPAPAVPPARAPASGAGRDLR